MKIVAVIVTYDRLDLLKEVLFAFDNQTNPPDIVIVVDNASTDNTSAYLSEWKKKNVQQMKKSIIRTEKNLGGSGGFYIGTKEAIKLGADWIWVSDDDAIPELDVFEKIRNHATNLSNADNVSAICTQVQTNGQIALSNRSYRKKKLLKIELCHVDPNKYTLSSFECDNFSYVGVMMNIKKLKEVGLIKKEYYIWRDDVEHSWRLSEVGNIICFPDMVVNHKVKTADYEGVSWKTYYAYRNDILMLKEHCEVRYVLYKVLMALYHAFQTQNKKERKLYIDAIKGAREMEKGLNPIYHPGIDFY